MTAPLSPVEALQRRKDWFDTYKLPHPTCPHCMHAMTIDEMVNSGGDIFAAAINETRLQVKCPGCKLPFWVKGGYKPHYTSAIDEEEL